MQSLVVELFPLRPDRGDLLLRRPQSRLTPVAIRPFDVALLPNPLGLNGAGRGEAFHSTVDLIVEY